MIYAALRKEEAAKKFILDAAKKAVASERCTVRDKRDSCAQLRAEMANAQVAFDTAKLAADTEEARIAVHHLKSIVVLCALFCVDHFIMAVPRVGPTSCVV